MSEYESENEMILPGRETIEAYISKGGLICLKQDHPMGEDPSIITMLPHDIPQIVKWLEHLAGEFPLSK